MNSLADHDTAYGGYNLVCGDVTSKRLWYRNNRGASTQELTPGLHSLSNGQKSDVWPKMRRGGQLLQPMLDAIDDSGQ